MFVKKIVFLFLFLLMGFGAMADTFVVTSNADAGPGTLRDALTQAAANDSTQTDHIFFNLVDISESGRTIILLSQLPEMTSNLIIDASSQPGLKFGVSDARVMLCYQTPIVRALSGLRVLNHHDVAIYGLYINLITNVNPPSNAYSFLYQGIELKNDKNIIIGASGKGNVISGFYIPLAANAQDTIHHLTTTFPFENLTLKDNLFGINADGETLSVNDMGTVAISIVLGQIVIGGAVGEGNVFASGLNISQVNYYDPALTANISIKNNKIGFDYNVTKVIAKTHALFLETIDPGGKNFYNIEDNVISTNFGNAVFIINNGASYPVIMLRNYINIDKSLQHSFEGANTGVFIYGGQIFIGSNNPADANYMTNCKPVNVWPFSTASINKNSFFCTTDFYPIYTLADDFPHPTIDIVSISTNSVSGTATPNSAIELFYSDSCNTCSPQTYFASTTAGADGTWQYNGPIVGSVLASATLNNSTSEFTKAHIDITNIKITEACSGLGSITGAVVHSAINIKWLNEAGTIVGTSPDLINVPPGKYKLTVDNGLCGDATTYFTIVNSLTLNTANIRKTAASCNHSDGSITGITFTALANPIITWSDAVGAQIGNTIDLNNVTAGSYTLTVKSADNSCTQIYGPVILQNTTGPNINQIQATIQSTNCGQSAGSITGITATGTGNLKYSWKNDAQQEVATTANLANMPAGKYTLEVTDETQCGPVYSSALTIPETNGITLDDSNVKTTIASCSNANGSVKGLQVTGATQYQWVNAGGVIVGTAIDLQNTIAGDYVFTASNNFGCSVTKTYHVAQQPATVYPVYTNSIINACFGQANGSVTVSTDVLVTSARWVNSQGVSVASGTVLKNAVDGVYKLYITDQSGCESLYNSYTVASIPPIKIVQGSELLVNDQCNLKTGSIKNIQVTGGTLPYSYSWRNSSNVLISSAADITGLGTGNYTLTVTDARSCFVAAATYLMPDNDNIIPPPSINNIQVCSPGDITIRVNNPLSIYAYRLYSSASSQQPLNQNSNGVFKITVKNNGSFYVTQVSGSCESTRSVVNVSVGIAAADIANTFTPNGDGINDYWKITGIENSPNALVQIFNRYGQKVFESKGYSMPFDGTFNGNTLPIGTYYYIINMGAACSIMSGSVTIIR